MSLFAIQPPPPVRQPISNLAAEVTYWARELSAWALVEQIAVDLDTPVEWVWEAMAMVPRNFGYMFDSPEGWAALAAHAALHLGVPVRAYRPSVH